MQVAQVGDLVTHAVIGANTAQSFGISESAEFFNILSNSLYSDKPLAVGRETLCNAWDAHIVSGRTDRAIEITLDGQKLVIRDHGTGIPKDKMHAVYCVYGASTKVHDGEQTGGFGLGCKAPFAYAEHFEVTNFNAGVKTIYRISKSSGEVGGKPGLLEILSVPTDETGIEVRVELKQQSDYNKFKEVIERIVAAGEMNATLNGKKLETLPFSGAKEGYLLTTKNIVGQSNHRIFVRYGNVVYPVEHHELYRTTYTDVGNLLSKLPGNYTWRLILQAKPNTVSITPSRESLSMSDHTIQTLNDLLTAFRDTHTKRYVSEVQHINRACIDQTFLNLKPGAVLSTEMKIVGLREGYYGEDILTDFGQLSRALVSKTYPTGNQFRKQDIEARLRSLIESGFGNRGKIQTFLAEFTNKKPQQKDASDWFHRRVIAPILMGMKDEPSVSPDRLLVYGSNKSRQVRERRFSYAENTFTEARKFKKNELEGYLPYLRNMILLSCNRTDVVERAPNFPEMRHWFGNVEESLVYVVHRSDAKIADAKAFFTKLGFWVVDLTKPYKDEPVPIIEERTREYKPRKVGIPKLSCLLQDGYKTISTDRAKLDDVIRIEKPEFYVKIGARNNTSVFEDWGVASSRHIVALFGDKGGIVVNDTQANKYRLEGALSLDEWLFDKVEQELRSNTRIHAHMTVDHTKTLVRLDYHEQEIVNLVFKDEVLSTYFDLSSPLTEVDKAYLELWTSLYSRFKWKRTKEVEAIHAFLNSFPTSDSIKKLIDAVKRSTVTAVVSAGRMESILGKTENTPIINMQKTKARDILIYALAA